MVEEELRKLDLIRERTHLGYEQARQLLQEAGGDVVQALILWERREQAPRGMPGPAEMVQRLRELVRRGNRTRIRVRRGDELYLELPVTAGVVAAALAPYLAAAGALACLALGCSVSFERAGARAGADAGAGGAGSGGV